MTVQSKIRDRQNSNRSLMVLKAIAVAHRGCQRLQALSLAASASIAMLGLLATTERRLAPLVILVGGSWALLYAIVVAPATGRRQRLAATLQEVLDTELFDLPWNDVAVGEKTSTEEISRLSQRFRGSVDRLRDYYLVADVSEPQDVLFCMEQNLAWGTRARARYARALVAVVVLWSVTGVVLGIVRDATIAELVSSWFIPSLGLILLCMDLSRGQTNGSKERLRVLSHVRSWQQPGHVPPPGTDWVIFARQVQDLLFHARCQQPRIPQWIFRMFHDRDQYDFAAKQTELEATQRRTTH